MPPETPPETPDETGPDPVLDPATAAAVRRLLAEARHDEPAPPAVVARLDATLAELRAGRTAPPPPVSTATDLPSRPGEGAPIDLAARRRRRRRGTVLLAAAAAVVVVGVGGVVVPRIGGSDDVSSFSGSGADPAPESQGDAGAGQAPQESAPDSDADDGTPSSPALPSRSSEDRIVAAAAALATYDGVLLAGDGRSLRTVSLDEDLAALLGTVAADPEPAVLTRCDVEPADGALGVVTTLDGESVVVEVSPTVRGAGVRVLDCDGTTLLQQQYGAR